MQATETKTAALNIRVPESLLIRVRQLAKVRHVTPTTCARILLEERLEQIEVKPVGRIPSGAE